jgi:Na+/alanine symporter
MILAGLLGMASKFTECILGVKYRNEYADGTVSGGPMYYLSKGLSEDGKATLGKFLAVFFSICCIGGALGVGNMFQANQSFAQISSIVPFFEGKGWLFGLIMAVIVGAVILGGIKSIARVTEKIVPAKKRRLSPIYWIGVLISCAMPPAKVPSASIFEAWMSWAWVSFRVFSVRMRSAISDLRPTFASFSWVRRRASASVM